MRLTANIEEGSGNCETCGWYSTLKIEVPEVGFYYYGDTHLGPSADPIEAFKEFVKYLDDTNAIKEEILCKE
jgi:hypothetical protein